ncbi:MAG: prepilin-type N-terminal cleavage/methylation domain-containing protein [Verrucomicrobiota bacterium]
MKTQQISSRKRGFTLMELMVAMAITTIIVTVLVSITSIALDTWNRSRAELRASRQAKSMIDTMARDFEALVTRRGNTNEWLSAISDTKTIGEKLESTNATKLIFFTAPTDRYEGEIGTTKDLGGDVSCVAYQLDYKDPIGAGGANSKFETFVLSRLLVNPDETFNDLLGKTQTDSNKGAVKSLDDLFSSSYSSRMAKPENFVCENIFQFSVTFYVQVSVVENGVTTIVNVPVTIDKTNSDSFRILGTGIEAKAPPGLGVTTAQLSSGRITGMQISVTVLSDFGVEQAKNRTFGDNDSKAKFFAQNSYEYTKVIQLPTM